MVRSPEFLRPVGGPPVPTTEDVERPSCAPKALPAHRRTVLEIRPEGDCPGIANIRITADELRAGGDWAVLAAEHWSDQSPSTPLGREDTAFFEPRSSVARRDDSRESN